MLAAKTAFLGRGKHLIWRKDKQLNFNDVSCFLFFLLIIFWTELKKRLSKTREKYRKGVNCFAMRGTKKEMQKN
jgi:hypothetical protein